MMELIITYLFIYSVLRIAWFVVVHCEEESEDDEEDPEEWDDYNLDLIFDNWRESRWN